MNFSMKNDSILARALKGLAVAITSLVVFGTVAALWENPLFVRMTPAGSFEIVLLTLLSVLLGIYVGIRRPFCSAKTATASGIVGFIGIACPVCNKVLLLAAAAIMHEWLLLRRQPVEAAT
jgi:predicted transporter